MCRPLLQMIKRLLACCSVTISFLLMVSCEELTVSACGGEGMDVTFNGPFRGLLTVKDSKCQIEVHLVDSSPMIFFVPYGDKCGIKVDRLGRAMFTLLIAEQKTVSPFNKVFYAAKEVTMLCTYSINVDFDIGADVRRGPAFNPHVTKFGPNDATLARNFVPFEVYRSPVIMIM